MNEAFEVRNQDVENVLRGVAEVLQPIMPEGWGFTLMIFNYSKPGADPGSMFYISSATRVDMVKAMMEFIQKQQEGKPTN